MTLSFDYTNRDFASIKDALLERATLIFPEWTSRDQSDFGMLLVDLWAYMGDVLHYYVDRASRETFLETATQRDSLLSIAKLLDYIPIGRTAAVSSIKLNASLSEATDASPILIPAGTQFLATPLIEGAEKVIFTLDRNIAFNVSGTPIVGYDTYQKSITVTVPVVEGEIFSQSFTSNGLATQKFTLDKTGVVHSSIRVDVFEGVGGNAIRYGNVERLIEYPSTALVYSVDLNSDDSSTLNFGNGVHGKVPTNNALINIVYRRSRGSAGNVASNAIKEFQALTNNLGPSYDGIVITPNTSRAFGGSDSESAASLKNNIPAAFRSQDRAVSLQDYIDLTLRVPGIVKATAKVNVGKIAKRGRITNKALSASVATLTTDSAHGLSVGETIAIFGVGEPFDGTFVVKAGSTGSSLLYDVASANVASASVSASVTTYMNAQVEILALTPQDSYDGTLAEGATTSPLYLNNSYRDLIYEYLRPREMVGVNSVIMPSVSLQKVKIECDLAVLSAYIQDKIVDDVQSAVRTLFPFDAVSFGQKITIGELYRLIMSVSGVDYVNITKFTTSTSGIDLISASPNVYGVQADNTKLFLLTEITVNGSGGITEV
jgi:uncharacterized phage protein gp47/JayE